MGRIQRGPELAPGRLRRECRRGASEGAAAPNSADSIQSPGTFPGVTRGHQAQLQCPRGENRLVSEPLPHLSTVTCLDSSVARVGRSAQTGLRHSSCVLCHCHQVYSAITATPISLGLQVTQLSCPARRILDQVPRTMHTSLPPPSRHGSHLPPPPGEEGTGSGAMWPPFLSGPALNQ